MFEVDDILKAANIYLAAKDINLKYMYCNENVAMGLGLDSPRGIIGKTDEQLFSDDIMKIYRSGDLAVLEGKTYLNVRELQPHTTKTIQILTTKNPLRNNQGKVIGVAVSFVDITGAILELNNTILKYDVIKGDYKFTIGNQEEHFTKREYDVFKFVLFGLTSKQIAKNLNLSHRTVESYLDKVKCKLQCGSKYHIPEAAMRMGIIHQNIIQNSQATP